MKHIAPALLIIAAFCGRAFSELPEVSSGAAFQLEARADMVANYDWDGKLDIMIGPLDAKGIRHSIKFSLEELALYFKEQKHKDLAVIILCKNDWTETKIAEIVGRLNRYFFDAGYARVVIQQGRGAGRGTHSDKTAKQQITPPKQPDAKS